MLTNKAYCSFFLVSAVLFAGVGGLRTSAQTEVSPYPKMAPIEQYLMARDAEIALARSAAAGATGKDATILVLTHHDFETNVVGKTRGPAMWTEPGRACLITPTF